jgi:parvulin-like peptidyl-prolyl isomerase
MRSDGYGRSTRCFGKRIAAIGMAVVLLAALPRPAAAAPATGPGAAAIVNGAEISRDELSAEIARRQRAMFPDSRSLTEPQKAQVEREAIDALISRELLYQEATRLGYKASAPEVDATIAHKKNRRRGAAVKVDGSGQENPPGTMTRSQVEKEITIRKFTDQEILSHIMTSRENITTTRENATNEEEARAWYDSHPEMYRSPRKVRVREILVAVHPGAGAEEKAKARARIEGLLERIRKGEDFGALAKAASDGPAREMGGDLGEFPPGRMPKFMEEAVSRLSVGQTSAVVEDPSGYHLFQISDEVPEFLRPYVDVRDRIYDLIWQQKVQKRIDSLVADLRESAKIEILDGARPR